MNVSLTPELEEFITMKLSTGRYQTASEVVREGLRLLEERERAEKPHFMVSSTEELRGKVREGVESLERGEYTEVENAEGLSKFFADMKAQGRARLTRASKQSA